MPYIPAEELAIIQRDARSGGESSALSPPQPSAYTLPGKLMMMGEGLGSAAAVGWLRGKFEDPATGQWNVPGTTVDWELLGVFGLTSVALAGDAVGLGKLSPHAVNAAVGVGGHYVGQVMRKFGRTGEFALVAGTHTHGLPPWDPTSYDPTQFASPYADQQAAGLASSGV